MSAPGSARGLERCHSSPSGGDEHIALPRRVPPPKETVAQFLDDFRKSVDRLACAVGDLLGMFSVEWLVPVAVSGGQVMIWLVILLGTPLAFLWVTTVILTPVDRVVLAAIVALAKAILGAKT